ncbi:hypothetical protein D3C85_831110 [compost metagenome]
MSPRWKAWRCSFGKLSGSARQTTTNISTPNAVRNQKIQRQPRPTCSQPPSTGAMAGASANTIMMCERIFCAAAPE